MTYHSLAGRSGHQVVAVVGRPVHPACDPTPRQLEILAEVIIHGDHEAAARCLGRSVHTVRNTVTNLYARIDASGYRHAAYLLGWMTIPDGVAREHGA